MSWAEDHMPEFYDEDDYPEGSDDVTVWVDKNYNKTPITLLETSHIKNILRGFSAGKSFWGQDWKAPTLRKILKQRGAL